MKKILSLLLLAVLVFTAVPVAVNAAVSPAIDVISKSVTAVKAGLYNCDVVFTKTDFSQNLGLNKIGSVTFTSVPPAEDGYLYIANNVIKDGTRVSEDMLDLLRGGEMKKSYEDFISPVFVMNALLRSIESGKREEIHKIEI